MCLLAFGYAPLSGWNTLSSSTSILLTNSYLSFGIPSTWKSSLIPGPSSVNFSPGCLQYHTPLPEISLPETLQIMLHSSVAYYMLWICFSLDCEPIKHKECIDLYICKTQSRYLIHVIWENEFCQMLSSHTKSLCYRTKLGSLRPCTVKPIYWHQVVGKESAAFIAGSQARRNGSSSSKDPNSPVAFREGFLKARWGRGLQGAWSAPAQFLDWLASRWSFKHHQPSGFNQSRVYVLAVVSFHLERVCFL